LPPSNFKAPVLRVRVKISSQIFSVEAPAWQGAKVQEYQVYSELSQRSQAGCIGAKNVKLFFPRALSPNEYFGVKIRMGFKAKNQQDYTVITMSLEGETIKQQNCKSCNIIRYEQKDAHLGYTETTIIK
jgi:hypothetical protein